MSVINESPPVQRTASRKDRLFASALNIGASLAPVWLTLPIVLVFLHAGGPEAALAAKMVFINNLALSLIFLIVLHAGAAVLSATTFGMKRRGIELRCEDGTRPSRKRRFLRILCAPAVPVSALIMLTAKHPERGSLTDRLSGCFVLEVNADDAF